jgi:hypothetical protein
MGDRTIENSLDDYRKILTNTLNQVKEISCKFSYAQVEYLRKNYDHIYDLYTTKMREIEGKKQYINNCRTILDACSDLLMDIQTETININKTSSEAKIGTLQGNCRQITKERNLIVNEEDPDKREMAQEVMKMKYNEKEEIAKIGQYLDSIKINEQSGTTSGGKKQTRQNKRKHKKRTRRSRQ